MTKFLCITCLYICFIWKGLFRLHCLARWKNFLTCFGHLYCKSSQQKNLVVVHNMFRVILFSILQKLPLLWKKKKGFFILSLFWKIVYSKVFSRPYIHQEICSVFNNLTCFTDILFFIKLCLLFYLLDGFKATTQTNVTVHPHTSDIHIHKNRIPSYYFWWQAKEDYTNWYELDTL